MNVREENKRKRLLVALAWKQERENILEGTASRDWTAGQQQEILNNAISKFYIGQWTYDEAFVGENDDSKIQLLQVDEYLIAHSDENKKYVFGFYEDRLMRVRPNMRIKQIFLSDPYYLSHKEAVKCPDGAENRFGIEVGARKRSGTNKLKNKEARKREYGF